jgi:protocatechuate 3,4-dioxygenase, alpha subunit
MSDSESALVASASQTVGPFFHVGPARSDQLGRLASADTAGEAMHLRVRVLDGDGVPVNDALVEIWQADATGAFSENPADGQPSPAFSGFGRLATDEDGWCTFETIRPGPVETPGGRQAAHFTVCLFMRGLLRHICTRIYFTGDPALEHDPVLAIVPESRRPTLLAQARPDGTTWEFTVHLQGDTETVFFDL